MRLNHLIYLEHQGQDEEDWAYEEEPADEEVDTNFSLKEFSLPNQAFSQQVVEEVTSSELREVIRIETFLR